MISSVWKAYSKFIFGTTCPILGTFTMTGDFIPSKEFCDACSVEYKEECEFDLSKYPILDY